MSTITITPDDATTLESILKRAGFDTGIAPGWGPKTIASLGKFADVAEAGQVIVSTVHPDATPAPTGDGADSSPVDARSEGCIATLLPEVQVLARELVHRAARAGITIKVTSGTRTYADQDTLYRQRPKVTNAPAGYSNHNFGLAFDVTIFNGATPVWDSPDYKRVGAMGKALGLYWGGDWVSLQDEPHFELRPAWAANLSESQMLAGLRERKESGGLMLA